jgi:hypothetical protein
MLLESGLGYGPGTEKGKLENQLFLVIPLLRRSATRRRRRWARARRVAVIRHATGAGS